MTPERRHQSFYERWIKPSIIILSAVGFTWLGAINIIRDQLSSEIGTAAAKSPPVIRMVDSACTTHEKAVADKLDVLISKIDYITGQVDIIKRRR